jgi:hypothetical protein
VDWIDRFIEVTDGNGSPEIFRLWSGISAVAGSMERRLWARTTLGILYPNLYVLLVAPPGIGKTQAIKPVEHLWGLQAGNLKIAPESMTKAALVDTMSDAHTIKVLDEGKIFEYSSLQLPVSELGVFVNAHDLEFLSVVNAIFDNGRCYRERRRHFNSGKEIQIINPQLNILAGTQPAFLSSILPEEAWGMGFCARFIMVYSGDETFVDLFGKAQDREGDYAELADWMKPWLKMYGQFQWTGEAIALMRDLNHTKIPPIPDHPKLENYRTRRLQFLIRLSMISTLSRTSDILIDAFDIERARHWLLAAEAAMPGAFRAMNSKTDAQLLDEMHTFCWREYGLARHQPLNYSILYRFLAERVPADRVPRIIDIAKKGRLIADLGMDMFRPMPRLDLVPKEAVS